MSKPDLAAVFDHYEVKYNPNTSGNQAIQCPVHDDSHASASCSLSKEVWNCHACGEGGDSITLIMLKEGCSYKAAVAFGKRFAEGSDSDVRGKRGNSASVPAGSGYRPRYFRALPSRTRQRPDYGS